MSCSGADGQGKARSSVTAGQGLEPIIKLENCKLVSQGAEARLFETTFLGKPTILKQRFNKKYRHPVLDLKLTAQRLKSEVRSIMKARKIGVLVPTPYFIELEANSIYMEKIVGHSVKTLLMDGKMSSEEIDALMASIGKQVAAMHDGGLIHGDLTTSNMMIRDSDKKLVIIDFGLSSNSIVPEDKAVDLYVLERAVTSAHSNLEGLFEKILASYKAHSLLQSATFNRLAEVRMRGRKRTMVG